MRKIYFLFFLLINFSFSQTKEIIVRDSQTLELIPQANVNFLNGKGTHSDDNGKIFIPKEITEIEVSHLGYITRRLKVSEVKDEIFIERDSYELEEITIENKKHKTKKIFPKKGISQFIPANYGTGAPLDYNEMKGVYIPNKEKKESIITKIYLEPKDFSVISLDNRTNSEKQKGQKYAPFKVNLYSVDTLIGIPKDKFFEQDFEVQLEKNEKYVIITIPLEEQILFPKEGVFVVVSSFEKAYYESLGFKKSPAFNDIGTGNKSDFKQFEKVNFWKRDDRAWEYNSVYYFGVEIEFLD